MPDETPPAAASATNDEIVAPTVVTADQIRAAAERIEGLVRRTPVLTVPGSDLGGIEATAPDGSVRLHLKLEQLQHSGSFKARGAMNTLLAHDVPPAGVVAASGGNHGAAVAWAAGVLGHRAAVFVPSIASPAKLARLESYGADLHVGGDVYADALAASQKYQAETGAMAVHAYDQPSVLAGAGTTGLELVSQVEGLDVVVVACGGGGLAGGLASWFGSSVQLVVVETHGTNTFAAAAAAGEPVGVNPSGLAADSLGASRIGDHGWLALRLRGAESVLVSDDEVRRAQEVLWDRFRIVTEPAAAAPIAAITSGRADLSAADNVGVIVCGANTDLS